MLETGVCVLSAFNVFDIEEFYFFSQVFKKFWESFLEILGIKMSDFERVLGN